jgi:hypothetical protein
MMAEGMRIKRTKSVCFEWRLIVGYFKLMRWEGNKKNKTKKYFKQVCTYECS